MFRYRPAIALEQVLKTLGFKSTSPARAMKDWEESSGHRGLAYVDDQNAEQMAEGRGTVRTPGTNSPFRDRSVEENLDLFRRMKAGEFADGEKVLRAKIDMAHANLNLRDPAMYRVRNLHHQRTGGEWCIYPMYDWAHGQSDSIEGVTHSLCTLEFEHHRPLYDWFCESLGIHHPQQIEFARLNVEYMLTSKRKLLRLVEEGFVDGWDDPRMPTIRGLRRRGVPAAPLAAAGLAAALAARLSSGASRRTRRLGSRRLQLFFRDEASLGCLRSADAWHLSDQALGGCQQLNMCELGYNGAVWGQVSQMTVELSGRLISRWVANDEVEERNLQNTLR